MKEEAYKLGLNHVFFTVVNSLWLFVSNYDAIVESYKYAKTIPNIFEINHIRFSLMLVIALFSAVYLYREHYFLVNPLLVKTDFIESIRVVLGSDFKSKLKLSKLTKWVKPEWADILEKHKRGR